MGLLGLFLIPVGAGPMATLCPLIGLSASALDVLDTLPCVPADSDPRPELPLPALEPGEAWRLRSRLSCWVVGGRTISHSGSVCGGGRALRWTAGVAGREAVETGERNVVRSVQGVVGDSACCGG